MEESKLYKRKDSKEVYLAMGTTNVECNNDVLETLTSNTVDAAIEKHIPVISYLEGKLIVKIGSTPHPMTEVHYIEWIFVQTRGGGQYKNLSPNDLPEAVFTLEGEEIIGVFAYCNLHGLWKATEEIDDTFSETVCSAEFPQGCNEGIDDLEKKKMNENILRALASESTT